MNEILVANCRSTPLAHKSQIPSRMARQKVVMTCQTTPTYQAIAESPENIGFIEMELAVGRGSGLRCGSPAVL